MSQDLPRLAIATTSIDCRDPRSWSGLPYSMHQAFERRRDIRTELVGPLRHPRRLPEGLRRASHRLTGSRYRWEVEPRILDAYRPQLADRLERTAPDGVLALGAPAMGAMPPSVPAVYYTDATLNLNTDYYPTFTHLARRSRRLGERLERQVFARAKRVVAASTWAATDIVESYGVDPENVTVLPMAAQHECPLDGDELAALSERRLDGPLRLLWMGAEWERKGGDVALATAGELHRRGVEVQLDLCGRVDDASAERLPYVRCHGFVDRRTRGALLEELFLSAFALLLPSRAENSSVVLADAASHALPSVASDTGGMPTMVHDGVNGQLVPAGSAADAYADVLLSWWSNSEEYLQLCRRSRARFEAELNWDHAVDVIAGITLDPALAG